MYGTYIQISELARLFNLTTHTLRFYEKKGLLKPSRISESNNLQAGKNSFFEKD